MASQDGVWPLGRRPSREASQACAPIDTAEFLKEKAQAHENLEEQRLHAQLPSRSSSNWKLVLWCLFGMSGWWSTNSISAELPLFVGVLPDAERMGSYLSMMIQLGNVWMIAYKCAAPLIKPDVVKVIYVMQGIACISLLCLAFLWDRVVWGHTVFLFAFTFAAGGVGCLSEVTFWARTMSYPVEFTKAFSVGTTLGGLLPMACSAAQMTGRSIHHPLFSARQFFLGAATFQGLSWLSRAAVDGHLHFLKTWANLPFSPRNNRKGINEGLVKQASLSEDMNERSPLEVYSWTAKGVESLELPVATALGHPKAGDGVSPQARDHLEKERSWSTNIAQKYVVSKSEGMIWTKRLWVGKIFLIYAVTYTLPIVLPFVAASYQDATEKQQILLWMQFLQNVGEVTSRALATEKNVTFRQRAVPFILAVLMVVIFTFLLLCGCTPRLLPTLWSYEEARLILPALSFMFFFSRGFLVTVLFCRVRQMSAVKEDRENLASNMGFAGQVGALSANIFSFLCLHLSKRR